MKLLLVSVITLFSISILAESKDFHIDANCFKEIEARKLYYAASLQYKMNYPQLYCKKKKNCLQKFNKALEEHAIARLNFGKSTYDLGFGDGLDHDPLIDHYYLSLFFRVTCNSFGFVSVRIYEEGYSGEAHPYHVFSMLLSRIDGDKLLTLTDLVYPTPEFWDFLSKEVSKSINSPNAEIPKKEDFKVFTLSDTDIEFTFSEYVIGSYIAGSFSGSIPISRIQKFLKPEIKKIYNLK